jgi:broad-specificity NMP kinase
MATAVASVAPGAGGAASLAGEGASAHGNGQSRPVRAAPRFCSVRVLITGMSATGKSSVVAALRGRGCVAYDVDDGLTVCDPADGRWHWRTDEVRRLLADGHRYDVFLAGCSEEQADFVWDLTVLLTVPLPVLVQRLRTRSGNTYGRSADERAQVLADVADVEPLLRRRADLVIDTTLPLASVVDRVLAAVREREHEGR